MCMCTYILLKVLNTIIFFIHFDSYSVYLWKIILYLSVIIPFLNSCSFQKIFKLLYEKLRGYKQGRKEQKFSKTSLEAVEKWCSSIQNVKTVVRIHLSQILETVFINLLIYVCIISNPVLNWDSPTSKFKGFFFPPCLLNLERIEKFSSFPII